MESIIEQAKDVLKIEAQGILDLIDRVGPEFEQALQAIVRSRGRVIITGIGKSGLVGRKISSTLSSTGTPSIFMHPAEALHGDLGMVTRDDVVLAISNSGHTHEINRILPMIKKDMGAKIISLTGSTDSPMARLSDIVIDVKVEREACPETMAPTTSTTAAVAMGDAMAVVLMKLRRFGQKDFKRFHPGGTLGERLGTKVKEVMFTGESVPVVKTGTLVYDAIVEIDSKGIGVTVVVDEETRVAGILTDGDLRRALMKQESIYSMVVDDIMTPSPRSIDENIAAAEALAIMELYQITHLIIIDGAKRLRGILHLHDILGKEEFRLNGGLVAD
ncbi:MAG: KpsF/GutQ family sugar-phosphate isomerase [Deltaproteobacteria bacterium]|nr:KpsF/GutQ family sugar-phosphate isomerase [Deltaproteobacteria bacterium]